MQSTFGWICAIGGSVLTFGFGLWPESLTLLLVIMALDYFTGVYASIHEKIGLNSEVGFWGLAKKGLMLLVILVAHRIDVLFATNAVMGGAIYFYLANELLSVVENCGRIGLPLPDRLKQIVQVLRDREGDVKGTDKDKSNGPGGLS